ncbi:WXG100 family type VII secretion target [Planosporangium flavigriseum]|uniref:WXG100 family type VII secretion target n=1 Tax=Planosporangium flavigriseum TaxID=373681 RepID=UPI00194E1F8C|nr:hypothetical protein [Planosporangium flavigriseum]
MVEDAAQIAEGIQNDSWVDGTLGAVGGSLDTLAMVVDPLGSLVAWGVSWLMEHVRPLKEALDWLAGNPDEISAHAATWENVARFTREARQQYADGINSETAYWVGESGDAYRAHSGMHLSVMDGISTAAHGISYAVQGAGLLVAMVRGIVRDLIAQVVGTLAARLPQWLAAEGLTLGLATPVVIGQVSALVSQWANKIQRFVRALLNSLRRLQPLLHRLGEILTELKHLLDTLARSNPFKRGGGAEGFRDPLAPHSRETYQYNMVEDPGPLAEIRGTPAANFAGGRYDAVSLPEDRVFYRGGDSQGSPLGQWFSIEPPRSVAEVRIDTAVRPQWINPKTGEWGGTSPVDTVYAVKIPAGTTVYPGPVANQGGMYVGGGHQVFIPEPWKNKDVEPVGSEPLP